MAKLHETAKLIRSKNAGPFAITFDIIFPNAEVYNRVLKSDALSIENVSLALDVEKNNVSRYLLPLADAVKFSIPRKYPAGDFLDDDLYGCQQHRKLVNLNVPD